MKMWFGINSSLVMALNLIYHNKKITFLHTTFVNVQTQNYKIHLATTPTSAVLSITNLKKLKHSTYTGKKIPTLETVIFNNQEENNAQTVKRILLKIKPLLDETT